MTYTAFGAREIENSKEVTSDEDGSGSSLDDVDVAEDVKACFDFQLDESIYTDAIVMPLVGVEIPALRKPLHSYGVPIILIVTNTILQLTLLYIMAVETGDAGLRNKMFGAPFGKGVCEIVARDSWQPNNQSSELDFRRLNVERGPTVTEPQLPNGIRGSVHDQSWLPAGMPGVVSPVAKNSWLDCRPELMRESSTWLQLDLDGDGVWTRVEAQERATRLANITALFDHWMRFIEAAAGNKYEQETSNYTILPKKTFMSESYITTICSVLRPSGCGSLEVRGVLPQLFPHIRTSQDRVAECRHIVKYHCHSIFGATFAVDQVNHDSICGKMIPRIQVSLNGELVKTATYKDSSFFTRGIVSKQWLGFMVLILIIWFTALIGEVRRVFHTWELFFFLPGWRGMDELISVEKGQGGDLPESIEIKGFANGQRLFMLLFVCIPRSTIVVLLTFIGAKFLLHTTSYVDAIMNSVALAFLLDMHSMLYVGFLSARRKLILTKVQPIKVKSPISKVVNHTADKFLPLSLMNATAVVVAAILFCLFVREAQYGWLSVGEAMACFCMLEGKACMNAYDMV